MPSRSRAFIARLLLNESGIRENGSGPLDSPRYAGERIPERYTGRLLLRWIQPEG